VNVGVVAVAAGPSIHAGMTASLPLPTPTLLPACGRGGPLPGRPPTRPCPRQPQPQFQSRPQPQPWRGLLLRRTAHLRKGTASHPRIGPSRAQGKTRSPVPTSEEEVIGRPCLSLEYSWCPPRRYHHVEVVVLALGALNELGRLGPDGVVQRTVHTDIHTNTTLRQTTPLQRGEPPSTPPQRAGWAPTLCLDLLTSCPTHPAECSRWSRRRPPQ
jgi:hypothetical protein